MSHQMMWLGDNILSYGRCVDPEETIAATQRVTADDVRALATTVFDNRRMSVATVTPVKDPMTAEAAADIVSRF
jgi:predicted Zn-dependent peptidase